MRVFENYEMFKLKCSICGSRNKIHTEILNPMKEMVGYTLTCCNCGEHKKFLLDYKMNGVESDQSIAFKKGKQHCIQKSYCSKKDCPLYGTCNIGQHDVDFKEPKEIENTNKEPSIDFELIQNPNFL